MPIRDDDPRPAYQQLADELRAAIASGQYQVGDRLPSTRELAEANGIALMTVRAAVGVLEDEKLVMARQGRGLFVTGTPEPRAGPAGPGELASVRETLQETMKLLQGINDRLDRMEAAGHGTEAATGKDPALNAERDGLDQVMDDLQAANAALDARDATGPQAPRAGIDNHIGHPPPPPEPDLDIGL